MMGRSASPMDPGVKLPLTQGARPAAAATEETLEDVGVDADAEATAPPDGDAETTGVELSGSEAMGADTAEVMDGPRGALSAHAGQVLDAYGERPAGVAVLGLEQIIAYALQNPLVQAAKQDVEAMEAQVKKTRFAWIPVISTEMTLMPGANIDCRDISITPDTQFQYCGSFDNENDVRNLNNIQDYFSQLGEAGIRFEFRASTVIPITTFGKLRNLKKLAKVGLNLKKLQQLQAEHETIFRVHQAYTTLVLARESLVILHEASSISSQAIERVKGDLGGDSSEDWDTELEQGDSVDLARDPDDLFKTELAAVEIAELSLQARRIEAVSLSALWAMAGNAAPRGFDIAQPRQPLYAVEGGLKPVRQYQEEALHNRPEAKMAAAAVLARRHQERLARANFLPDLGVLLNFGAAVSNAADRDMRELYYTNNFNYTRLTVALAMRWKWDFHFKAFDLQSARATQRSAEYQEEAARLLLAQEVEQAYRELVEAMHDIELERQAVDLSWKLVVSAQQKDTLGGGDAGELVKYLETWYRKRFELAEAIQHHNHAVARLSRAVGTQLASVADR